MPPRKHVGQGNTVSKTHTRLALEATSRADFQRDVDHLRIVSIDPGLQGTGLAVWERGTLVRADVLALRSVDAQKNWAARVDLLIREHMAPHVDAGVDMLVCEMMEFQGGGARGLGWRNGDMQRTTYFIGALAGHFHWCDVILVPVHVWKGQLPKDLVESRLRKRIPETESMRVWSHAWDAVGIGAWTVGRF